MHEIKQMNEQMRPVMREAKRMAKRYGRVGVLDADDVAQAAIVKMLKRTQKSPLSNSWLFAVVRSTAFDALRKHCREARYLTSFAEPDCFGSVYERADQDGYVPLGLTTYMPHDEDDSDERLSCVQEVVSQLKEPLRDVLLLYAQGLTYEAIAAKTNVSIGTVRSRLHHARKQAMAALGALK